MFDIAQAMLGRKIVEAHGRKWVTLYYVGATPDMGSSFYLATPVDAQLPAPVSMIAVPGPRLPSDDLREEQR